MAVQHLFTFKTEDDAKIFQLKIHKDLRDIVSCRRDNEVTVIDGKTPPQTSELHRLSKNSTGSFAKAVH